MRATRLLRQAAQTASSTPSSATARVADSSASPLRIIALPLCAKPELIYYYAHKRKGKAVAKDPGQTSSAADAPSGTGQDSAAVAGQAAPAPTDVSPVLKYMTKATNFAAEKWEQFGKADKGNWKYKTYMMGESMMDRIEYEEWQLKALDATTAPKLRRPKVDPAASDGSSPAQQHAAIPSVPLYYPSSAFNSDHLVKHFSGLLKHREPHHRSLMKKSLWLAPLTLPFALLPVVPNFPLFYVLWRGWSHWRALKSSEYLQGLITHDHLAPTSSKMLDELYAARRKQLEAESPVNSVSEPSRVLLTHEMVSEVLKAFGLEDQAGVDLRRAISQAEARLKDSRAGRNQ